jgi:hypothetical protein
MSQQELLTSVLRFLNRSDMPFMLTGSVVSSIQGEPRLTHDIDLVVVGSPAIIPALSAAFPAPKYYWDAESVRLAISTQTMFDLIETPSGDKVDFWMLTESRFDECRFSRRISVEFFGENAQISTPEDTILAKLKWAKASGGSEKQLTDALRVYQTNFEALDQRYLQTWVLQLGLREEWQELLRRSDSGAQPS